MKGREYFKQKRIDFTKRYYRELAESKESGKLIAYVTGFLPSEVLVAMDILPYYPETFATIACAFNAADELCQVARTPVFPVICAHFPPWPWDPCIREKAHTAACPSRIC